MLFSNSRRSREYHFDVCTIIIVIWIIQVPFQDRIYSVTFKNVCLEAVACTRRKLFFHLSHINSHYKWFRQASSDNQNYAQGFKQVLDHQADFDWTFPPKKRPTGVHHYELKHRSTETLSRKTGPWMVIRWRQEKEKFENEKHKRAVMPCSCHTGDTLQYVDLPLNPILTNISPNKSKN